MTKTFFCFIKGIKGWYSLASANRAVTSEKASDPSEHCVGGLELFVHFGQQDDRRRIIDSAKALGWLDDNYIDEENFLDGRIKYLNNKSFYYYLLFQMKKILDV